jgi:hypothetical protein
MLVGRANSRKKVHKSQKCATNWFYMPVFTILQAISPSAAKDGIEADKMPAVTVTIEGDA